MKYIWKALFAILIIGTVCIYISIIKVQNDKTKDTKENIEKTQSMVDNTTARVIIEQIETAYSTAYMINASHPTLEQIKSNFKCDNVVWKKDSIIESQNFNCNVEVNNSILKVICLNYETKDDLVLSD